MRNEAKLAILFLPEPLNDVTQIQVEFHLVHPYAEHLSTYSELARSLRSLWRGWRMAPAHYAPNGIQHKGEELDGKYFNYFDVLLLKNSTAEGTTT